MRVPSLFRRFVQISITDLRKQIPHTESLALKYGSTKAKFFPKKQKKGVSNNVNAEKSKAS